MHKLLKTKAASLAVLAMLGTAIPASAKDAAAAAAPAAPSDKAIGGLAEAVLAESYPADGPGAAVVVMRGGKVIYAGGRGLADVAGKRAIAPDTVFRLGSITKQFTAAVIVQLAQEGKLSLDDPLSRFLPDYPQPGGSATVRQLLNHTSGIQSYTDIPGAMAPEATAKAYSTAELIATFRDKPAPTKPGEAWAYNNSGYVLLGAIIEQVTGKPWHVAVDERIVRPLGLTSIRYGLGVEGNAAMAKGYTSEGDNAASASQPIDMSVPHAAGALIGTVGDLAKWAQALHHGKVVDKTHYKLMIAPTVMPDGSTVPYGFGLAVEPLRAHPSVGHGGGIFGFSTDSLYVPQADLFVAVFANSDSPATRPGVAMRRIAAAAIGDPYPAFSPRRVDVAAYAPLTGIYAIADAGEHRFFLRDGKFYAQWSGDSEMEVFPAGDGRFFYGSRSLSWFRLTRGAEGKPVMEFYDDGENEVLIGTWTGPIPAEAAAVAVAVPREVLERYAGSYALGPAKLTIALSSEGGLTAQLTGQPPIPLSATGETEFRTLGVDARLIFDADGGAVTLDQGGRQMRAVRTAN